MPRLKLISMQYKRSIMHLENFLNIKLARLVGLKLVKLFFNSNDKQIDTVLENKSKLYLVLKGPTFTMICKKVY